MRLVMLCKSDTHVLHVVVASLHRAAEIGTFELDTLVFVHLVSNFFPDRAEFQYHEFLLSVVLTLLLFSNFKWNKELTSCCLHVLFEPD